MLNMLIIDDNINYIKNLISIILKKEENIRLIDIALDGKEALKILTEFKVDIILLDLKMPNISGIQLLEYLTKKSEKKYRDSIIVITGEGKLLNNVMNNPLVYSYELKPIKSESLLEKIEVLVSQKLLLKEENQLDEKILNEINILGYNLSHIGTIYLKECIKIDYIKYKGEAENINKQIYPIVSKKYKKSNFLIKNSIIKATNYMYNECEIDKLIDYFQFESDHKPTPKMVIKTIVRKI